MITLTIAQVDRLIAQRDRLTDRRDEQIDFAAVDAIDAQLAQVPAGQDNRIDLYLHRPSAVLPERVEYQRWSTDEQRAAWQASGAAETARLAEEKRSEHDAYLESIADQYPNRLEWNILRGDLAI